MTGCCLWWKPKCSPVAFWDYLYVLFPIASFCLPAGICWQSAGRAASLPAWKGGRTASLLSGALFPDPRSSLCPWVAAVEVDEAAMASGCRASLQLIVVHYLIGTGACVLVFSLSDPNIMQVNHGLSFEACEPGVQTFVIFGGREGHVVMDLFPNATGDWFRLCWYH